MKRTNVIASGHFAPLHTGHVRYLKEARWLGDYLIVIVNSDLQCRLKTGYSFMPEQQRLELIDAIRWVNFAFLALDEDRSVSKSLEQLVNILKGDRFVFANGGDVGNPECVRERETCQRLGIEMVFGVGGREKIASSSKLIAAAAGRS